jgi:hypothetical protein
MIELLDDERWALSDSQRRDYDEARIAHHTELVVVTTSKISQICGERLLLTLMNQPEIGARRGLGVAGAAATGKTTALNSWAGARAAGARPALDRSVRNSVMCRERVRSSQGSTAAPTDVSAIVSKTVSSRW